MRRLLAVTFAFAMLIACKPGVAVNSDSGTEIPCTSDTDCSAALDAGNCSSEGVCVICSTDTPCPTGEICDNGTCEISSGSGGSTGGSNSGGATGGSTGGITPGQCTNSCDCLPDGGSAIKGPACVSGVCAPLPKLPDGGPTCTRTNDCVCGDFCSAGTCQPQCTQNSDCPTADPFCYLPQGQCGPCTNSQECATGESCVGGKCSTSSPDGGCSASHCCSSGDCLASLPVCNNGVCSKCTTSVECSAGYVCNTTSGACVVQDGGSGGGCGPNGCTGNLVCSTGACVASTCNPPCGPPATCGANNNCTCPANCGGICATGQTCDTATCQCGAGSGGTIGGASGGFPSGGLIGGASGGFNFDAGPSCTLSGCGGCPSGTNCYCFDVSSFAYDIACTGSIACAIEAAIDPTGTCH